MEMLICICDMCYDVTSIDVTSILQGELSWHIYYFIFRPLHTLVLNPHSWWKISSHISLGEWMTWLPGQPMYGNKLSI